MEVINGVCHYPSYPGRAKHPPQHFLTKLGEWFTWEFETKSVLARPEAGHPLFNGIFIFFLLATPKEQNKTKLKTYNAIKLEKGVGRDTATAEVNYSGPR